MAFILGATFGGFLISYVVAYVVGRFLFRSDPPFSRALKTSLAAWLVVGAIAGWGMADGGPFRWQAYFYYFPGVALFFFHYKRKLDAAWGKDVNTI